MSWDEVTHAFFAAAGTFDRLLDAPEVIARWDEPSALEGYTIGGIVGHVSAALAWTEPMLDTPEPQDLRPIRLGNYYAGLKITESQRHPMHDVLRDMSEKAARYGPEATGQRLRALIDRLRVRLPQERGERILDMRPAVPAAVRLDDFLRTRVLELVVHGDDLAASVALDATPASETASVAMEVLMHIARAAHGDLGVIRALARRERAAAGVFPVF